MQLSLEKVAKSATAKIFPRAACPHICHTICVLTSWFVETPYIFQVCELWHERLLSNQLLDIKVKCFTIDYCRPSWRQEGKYVSSLENAKNDGREHPPWRVAKKDLAQAAWIASFFLFLGTNDKHPYEEQNVIERLRISVVHRFLMIGLIKDTLPCVSFICLNIFYEFFSHSSEMSLRKKILKIRENSWYDRVILLI